MAHRFRFEEVFPEQAGGFGLQHGVLNQEHFGRHSHGFIELVLVFGGSAVHLHDEDEYPIGAGDVFLLRGKRVHGFRHARQLDLANLMIDPRRYRLPEDDLRKLPGYHALLELEPRFRKRHAFESRLRLRAAETAQLRRILERMEREYFARKPGWEAMVRSILVEMLVFLSRQYGHTPPPAGRSLLDMAEVISYLEECFAEPCTVASLADRVHMAPNTFLRHFREATGQSPIDYLLHLRLRRAAALLREGERRVTEVALAVGFSDSNYFSRQFRKAMGCSPSAYRRRTTAER